MYVKVWGSSHVLLLAELISAFQTHALALIFLHVRDNSQAQHLWGFPYLRQLLGTFSLARDRNPGEIAFVSSGAVGSQGCGSFGRGQVPGTLGPVHIYFVIICLEVWLRH